MNKIVEIIESFKRKRFSGGVQLAVIAKAEQELKLTFADDFKVVLLNYGFLNAKGEEFLGIDTTTYDVVKATKEARAADVAFPDDVYVVENCAIDGLLLVQRTTGEVASYQRGGALQQVAANLSDYLSSL